MNGRRRQHRRGTVLIVVMVVVFVLAAMVLTLGRQVQTDAVASQKADAAERGAEQFALSVLSDYKDSLPDMTQDQFTAVPVGDSYFWITRTDFGDSTLPNWGLLDESTKMPLNDVTQDQLAAMPGMTTDLASAVVAYHGTIATTSSDATTDATSSDASSSSSSSASGSASSASSGTTDNGDGTIVKNAPFESVAELALVQGFTHDLLYGPPGAAVAADSGQAMSGTGDWYVSHGIADYYTVWSGGPNPAADGPARISYNDQASRDALTTLLADKLGSTASANEILARIAPPRRGPPTIVQDIFDFADKTAISADDLAKIEDYVTNDATVTTLPGRVNINTAPREVLLALGTLSSSDVDALLAARPDAIASTPNSLAWVYGVLKDKAIGLGSLVCAQGKQYSADITAVSGDGRGFRHVKVVVDTSTTPAKIVFRRDLSDKGWPLDPQILESLKSGQGLTTGASAAPQGMR